MLVGDFLVQLQEGREKAILVVGIIQLGWKLWKEGRPTKDSNGDCYRIIKLNEVRLLLMLLERVEGDVHNCTCTGFVTVGVFLLDTYSRWIRFVLGWSFIAIKRVE